MTDASKQTLEQAWYRASHHFLFSSFPHAACLDLEPHSRVVLLQQGEDLFRQDTKANHFYLVLEGAIKLFRVSPDGHEKIIEVVNPNHTFAEAVMFMDRKRYPVNAQAISKSQVLSINSEAYKSVLLNNASCCLKFMGNMAERLHTRINEIETLTMQNARHRLVRFLVTQLPDPSVTEARIRLPMAKRLIASRLAMQPETFSRTMHELKEKKVLSVKGAYVHIYSVPDLLMFD